MVGYMVELEVRDWAASVAWYRDTLGLPVALLDAPRQFVLFEGDGLRLSLKGGTPTPGGVRLYWRVGDLQRERDRLVAAGVTETAPVAASAEGYRRAVFADPDGYSVGLFEWAD